MQVFITPLLEEVILMKEGKKILVTGGAGFIGTNLIKRLLQSGEKVICLDNFYTGTEGNIAIYKHDPNFICIEHDITKEIEIEIDEIYHLACPASPPQYQRDPIKTMKTNILGTLNMLELAKKHKAKILLASTSEVYGNPLVHPQTESYLGNVNPTGIRACYDEGKRAAEALTFDFHRQHQLNIRVIRIFNTYGPNMNPNDGRVVSNFITQALMDNPITIYGDGSQTRSFCYIDDLIDGIIRMMNADDSFVGPVNLGNPTEFTVSDLAEKIKKLTGSRSTIVYKPLPKDDPIKRKPDITLAKEQLGWQPKIQIDEGLKLTIDYFKNKVRGQQGGRKDENP